MDASFEYPYLPFYYAYSTPEALEATFRRLDMEDSLQEREWIKNNYRMNTAFLLEILIRILTNDIDPYKYRLKN
jgi:hypothetical protein